MTISSTNRKAGPFPGNGVATSFPFGFKVFKTSDVLVTFTGANGVDSPLVLDSDYSVTLNTDQDSNPGGVVTYPRTGAPISVLNASQRLTLSGDLPPLQSTDLPDLSPWFPHVVEDALDRAVILIQQLQEQVDRAIKISVSDVPLTPLPTAANRANEIIGFDAAGNLILYPLPSSVGAGDLLPFTLTAGVDFNPGDVRVTLPRAPGTAGNLHINFDGFAQDFSEWTVAGTTVTFTRPIPAGVGKIWGYIGSTLSTIIPPNGSIMDAMLVQGTKLYNRITDIVDIKDPGFGARGDGSFDDRAAFAAAEAAGKAYTVPAGTYRIGSAITLSSGVTFAPGAVLKPDSGVLVTIAGPVNAGLYQIFDRSAGGCIQFQTNALCRVFAEWWGAKADGTKTNNEIAIQQACDALQCVYANGGPFTPALNGDNNGGRVLLGFGGTYLISGVIKSTNRVVIVGTGTGTSIKANAATWAGTTMFQFQNGTSAMFFSRIENLYIDVNNVAAISRVIYAPGWQESCGLRDVVIINHKYVGLYLDQGYGGSVGISLRDVQMFASATAIDPYGVYADFSTYNTGWYNLVMQNCSIFCGAPAGALGRCVSIKGRVRLDVTALHVGEAAHGVYLETSAVLCGTTLGADSGLQNLITYDANWTGYIDLSAPKKGFASTLLRRSDANWTLFKDFEPIFGRLRYPHPPGEIVAMAAVNNGTTVPTLGVASRGFSAVSKIGTGLYRLTFDATVFSASSGTAYISKARADNIAGSFFYIAAQTATTLDVQFRGQSGATADCSDFYIEVCGNPGA